MKEEREEGRERRKKGREKGKKEGIIQQIPVLSYIPYPTVISNFCPVDMILSLSYSWHFLVVRDPS